MLGCHRGLLLFILCLLATPVLAAAAQTAPTAEVEIRVSQRPQDTELTVRFLRSEATGTQLLVTALPIPASTNGGMPGSVELASFDDFVSQFGGWFVAQSDSYELWLGSTLGVGELQGEIVVRAPGLLRALPVYPEQYELIWRPPSPTAKELAGGSSIAAYADIVSVTVTVPTSLSGEPAEDHGWDQTTSGTFVLSPHQDQHRDPHVLNIQRLPNLLMIWLQESFTTFFLSFLVTSIAVMVAVVEMPAVAQRRKPLLAGVAILTSTVAYLATGGGPSVFRGLLFDAEGLVGVFLASVLFLFLTDAAIAAAREATERGRFGPDKASQVNHSPDVTQGGS